MQNTLLPAARSLYKTDTASLDAQQDDATSVPWLGAVLLVALLVALFFAQRFVTRRTNRVLNIGLLVASIAMVLTLLWSAVGLILTGVQVSDARSAGSDLVAQLSQARSDALQARSDEILNLVARGGENYDPQFHSLAGELGGKDGTGGLLGAVESASQDPTMSSEIDSAINAAKSWFSQHDTVQNLNNTGDYPNAVSITLSSGGTGEAAMVANLDSSLDKAITQGRTIFADDTNSASAALFGWPIGLLVLAVLAAVGSAVGIWQRLREYR
jgi:Na+/proline symporter